MALPLLALGATILRAASPAIARILKSAGAKTVSSGKNIKEVTSTDAARKAVQKLKKAKKITKVALGKGEKGRRSGLALRDKKTGKLEGVSKKDQRTAKNIRKAGAAVGVGVGAGILSKNKKETQAETPSSVTARIKRGDTLSGIAKEAGVSLKEIMAANPKIDNANDIKVGQRIKIPSKSGRGTYEGMSRSEMRAISRDREDQGDTPFRKGGMVKKKNYGAMDYRKGGMVLNVTDNRRKSRG